MSQSMAGQKRFSTVGHRDLPQHHGFRRGERVSFVSTREPNTPPCSPKRRLPEANSRRVFFIQPTGGENVLRKAVWFAATAKRHDAPNNNLKRAAGRLT